MKDLLAQDLGNMDVYHNSSPKLGYTMDIWLVVTSESRCCMRVLDQCDSCMIFKFAKNILTNHYLVMF